MESASLFWSHGRLRCISMKVACAQTESTWSAILATESAACLPVFLPCKAQAGESFVLRYASSER